VFILCNGKRPGSFRFELCAKATASAIVLALGGSADDKSVDAIVKAQLKG